jgi:hypothetical protein
VNKPTVDEFRVELGEYWDAAWSQGRHQLGRLLEDADAREERSREALLAMFRRALETP